MLIGTMLVGAYERGLRQSLESFGKCGCDAIYVLVDMLDVNSWALVHEYKCNIISRKWDWEFGPARDFLQQSLPSGCDWQLWLDADDIIPDDTCDQIKQIVTSGEKAVYSMPYVYVDPDNHEIEGIRVERDRLFPSDGVRWIRRVHEHPVYPDGLQHIHRPDMPILHAYLPNTDNRAEHYIEGLQKDRIDMPGDTRTLYYLAQSFESAGRTDESIETFEAYLAAGGWDEERMAACIRLSIMYQYKGDVDTALKFAKQANQEKKHRRETHQRIGEVYYALQNWSKAYEWFRVATETPFPTDGLFYVQGNHYAELPYRWLAIPCDQLGKYSKGLEYARKVLEYIPDDGGALGNVEYFTQQLNKPTESITDTSTPTIYFYVGYSCERWNSASVNTTGIGGRETSNIHMAKEMQNLGWNVVLFSDCQGMDGEIDGVLNINYSQFYTMCERDKPDVVFTSGRTSIVDIDFFAKLKIFWIHDIGWGDNKEQWPDYLTDERYQQFDKLFFMSPSQMQHITSSYGLSLDKAYLTRSGIKVKERFGSDVKRQRHRLIYSSSADRGLEYLLDYWPEIKERVPEAELHVYYGFLNALESAQGDKAAPMKQWVESLMTRMDDLLGVEYHDRISQPQLAIEFQRSSVWAYPTWFWETMCLSALEASAAGCPIVTSNLAALQTTVGRYGTLIEGQPSDPEYREQFIDEVVRLLTDDAYWNDQSKLAMQNVYERFNDWETYYWDWKAIAQEWDQYLKQTLGIYQPVIVEIGSGEYPIHSDTPIIHTDARKGLEHIECVCDMKALPFKRLDKIISHQVLEHASWRDTMSVLEGYWDALCPSGVLEIAVPNFYHAATTFLDCKKNIYEMSDMVFAFQDYSENCHKTAFIPASLRSLFARVGFAVNDIQYHDSITVGQKPELDKHEICRLGADYFDVDMLYSNALVGDYNQLGINLYNHNYCNHSNIVSPELSIVVIARDQLESRTKLCVETIKRIIKGRNYELIGVDDASQDDTGEFFRHNTDVSISLNKRQGICLAYNAGIKASAAPYVCLVQNDVIIPDGFFDKMLQTLKDNPNLGLLAGWHTLCHGAQEPEGVKILPSTLGNKDRTAWSDTPPGPCMMFCKRNLSKMGMFDPYLYNMWSDHDIMLQAQSLGLDVGILTTPITETFPNNVTAINDHETYTRAERIRRFLSVYYFHLKWNYPLNADWVFAVEGVHP